MSSERTVERERISSIAYAQLCTPGEKVRATAGLDARLSGASKARAGTIGTRSQSACRRRAFLSLRSIHFVARPLRPEKGRKDGGMCIKAAREIFRLIFDSKNMIEK